MHPVEPDGDPADLGWVGDGTEKNKMHEHLVENCRKYGVTMGYIPPKCIKMSVLLRKMVDQQSDFVGFPIILNTHLLRHNFYIQTICKYTHIHEVKSSQEYPTNCFC